jgi:hypothetical protein
VGHGGSRRRGRRIGALEDPAGHEARMVRLQFGDRYAFDDGCGFDGLNGGYSFR